MRQISLPFASISGTSLMKQTWRPKTSCASSIKSTRSLKTYSLSMDLKVMSKSCHRHVKATSRLRIAPMSNLSMPLAKSLTSTFSLKKLSKIKTQRSRMRKSQKRKKSLCCYLIHKGSRLRTKIVTRCPVRREQGSNHKLLQSQEDFTCHDHPQMKDSKAPLMI